MIHTHDNHMVLAWYTYVPNIRICVTFLTIISITDLPDIKVIYFLFSCADAEDSSSSGTIPIDWMHGTACAPGYPSDSTRSLAGVGPQDEWRAAARTTTSRPQRGMRAATLPGAPRAGRAGGRRGRPDRCQPRPPRCRPRLAPPSALPSTVRTGAARQDSPTPPRFLIRHHPRPPCGRGWCRSAGKSRVRGGTPRDLSRSLTLAGVGQCSLADGHGRQAGRSRSAGSSARVATGGPGGRSVGAGRACGCR